MSLYRSGRGIWRAGQGGLATAKPVAAASDIYAHLVSWWAMEEAAGAVRTDSHQDYDLSVSGTVTRQTGQIGYAMSSNQAGHLYSENAAFRVNGTFAVAGWLKQTFHNHRTLISIWQTGDLSYILYGNYSAGFPEFKVRNADDTATYTVRDSTVLANGVWFLFAGYYDATAGQIGISVNGSAYTTAAAANGMRAGTGNLTIGKYLTVEPYGAIDEVAFWSGYVPSVTELSWLYNAGAGRSYAEFAAQYGGSG